MGACVTDAALETTMDMAVKLAEELLPDVTRPAMELYGELVDAPALNAKMDAMAVSLGMAPAA